MQLDLFPSDLLLRSIDPARNRRRFYAVTVQQTLFGEWCLVRRWGRIGSYGRDRTDVYASPVLAIDALNDLTRKKARRGYCLVT